MTNTEKDPDPASPAQGLTAASKHVQRDQDACDAAKTKELPQKFKANPAAFMQEVYESWKTAALISAASNSFLYRQSLGIQNAIRRLVEIGLKGKK